METTDGKTCGAKEAGQICGLPPGHEDPEHPHHAKHAGNGEPLHKSAHAAWPVDVEGAKQRSDERRAAIIAAAKSAPTCEE